MGGDSVAVVVETGVAVWNHRVFIVLLASVYLFDFQQLRLLRFVGRSTGTSLGSFFLSASVSTVAALLSPLVSPHSFSTSVPKSMITGARRFDWFLGDGPKRRDNGDDEMCGKAEMNRSNTRIQ